MLVNNFTKYIGGVVAERIGYVLRVLFSQHCMRLGRILIGEADVPSFFLVTAR